MVHIVISPDGPGGGRGEGKSFQSVLIPSMEPWVRACRCWVQATWAGRPRPWGLSRLSPSGRPSSGQTETQTGEADGVVSDPLCLSLIFWTQGFA